MQLDCMRIRYVGLHARFLISSLPAAGLGIPIMGKISAASLGPMPVGNRGVTWTIVGDTFRGQATEGLGPGY